MVISLDYSTACIIIEGRCDFLYSIVDQEYNHFIFS